jgi:hypothetical protein
MLRTALEPYSRRMAEAFVIAVTPFAVALGASALSRHEQWGHPDLIGLAVAIVTFVLALLAFLARGERTPPTLPATATAAVQREGEREELQG